MPVNAKHCSTGLPHLYGVVRTIRRTEDQIGPQVTVSFPPCKYSTELHFQLKRQTAKCRSKPSDATDDASELPGGSGKTADLDLPRHHLETFPGPPEQLAAEIEPSIVSRNEKDYV